ncbi:MAG: hypothetical protein ACLGJC_17235 [Alphaproteobacteria bacterium]
MLVTIVSDCCGAAWHRTRRIVDSFLVRIGERTWTGHLTEEGLEKLRAELVDIASKNTAVAAHRAVGTRRTELIWIVGSARLFGPNGERATYTGHAYDRYLEERPRPVLSHHDILADAVAFAGLWHDVGKANPEFQDKLRRGAAEADSVRHEVLSALAFVDVCRFLRKRVGDNASVITEHLVREGIAESIAKPRTFRGPEDSGVPNGALAPADLPQPLRLVAWLIATHHRLLRVRPIPGHPAADDNLFTLERHAHLQKFAAGPRTIVLDPRIEHDELVRRTVDLYPRLVHTDACIALVDWKVNSTYGRLGLILADRYVSRSGFEAGRSFHNGVRPGVDDLNANWETLASTQGPRDAARERPSGQGDRVPKQSVIEHLVRVSDESRLTMSDIMAWPAQGRGIDVRALPPAVRRPSAGRFAWQNEAKDALSAARQGGAGFFGLLMAGTGAGKTRAIPKILSALGPELRYTLGLSLRSLTLQAGTSYRRELGLTETEVATVIGDGAVAALHETALARADGRENTDAMMTGLAVNPRFGRSDPASFDDAGEMLASDTEPSDPGLYELPEEIARHVPAADEPGAARLLGTPIVVCTIDQLMAAADARRTSYLVAALRLMSADLVLDEADNFDEMDFVALGRLIYLAGLFGRAVLLSSATIPPAQAKGLFAAYRSGFLAHAAAAGRVPSIDVGFFGDGGPPGHRNLVSVIDDVATFETAFAVHAEGIVADLRNRPPLRRAAILPHPQGLDAAARRQELFGATMSALRRTHESRAETCPRTRRRLSIQLIKVSHVRRAVELARWMTNNGGAFGLVDGCELRLIVYHGAFPLLQRNMIEGALDQLLRDRHKGIFGRPIVKGLMRQAHRPDVMIVVIATGVEEVGRDHDFDGAVIEPSSSRSIIQCCGRVERHRLRPVEQPNVHLLPAPLSFLLDENDGRSKPHYSRPGVEQAGSGVIGRSFRLGSSWLETVINPEAWSTVTAIPRLQSDPQQELVALEHAKTDVYLNGPSYYALREFHAGGSQAFLAANHADVMRFRQSEPEVTVWFDPSGPAFRTLDDDAHAVGNVIRANMDGLGLGDMRLLDLSSDAILQELGFSRNDLRDEAIKDRLRRRAKQFLRISVTKRDGDNRQYLYCPDFGVFRN